jgi:folate-dependent phosphoribosylglycinamide formyltransferase PurN
MADLDDERAINQQLFRDDPGRKTISLENSSWGELILPASDENPRKAKEGFRILVFASVLLGYLLLETLTELEKRNPGRLNIVGLITDDPANLKARISAEKRIWRFYAEEKRVELEKVMIESALTSGIPCFTGQVKTESFRELLARWNPQAILVCVFGQILDKPIIDYPAFGIYNFHPADLVSHHGAGPKPYEDLIARKAECSKVTVHRVTEEVDAGPVVGQSPPINVRLKNGGTASDVLVINDKMLVPIDRMAACLVSELVCKWDRGESGCIKGLNFEELFSQEYKEKLMQPIDEDIPKEELPLLDKGIEFSVDRNRSEAREHRG